MIATKTKTHRISTSKNAEIELVVQRRGEYPVFVEPINPDIVRIPMGESIFDSVFVKREYAKGSAYEEPKGMKFFRRGRTLSIVLDEPIVYNAEEYAVIEVKGCGADTYKRKMVIGFKYDKNLNPKVISRTNTIWGALSVEDAQEEIEVAQKLSQIELPMTPHIKTNRVPQTVLSAIVDEEGGPKIEIAQVVRVAKTNIRPKEIVRCGLRAIIGEREIERLVQADKKIIEVERRLNKEHRRLIFEGATKDNRYLDGTLTDAENIRIVRRPTGFDYGIDIQRETEAWMYELDQQLAAQYNKKMREAT